MIDLHTHTLLSDGELTPAEHIRRAAVAGYRAIAITDHADSSSIQFLCKEISAFAKKMNRLQTDIAVIAGIELTHVLPEEIKELTEYARGNGAGIVLVHGETIVEPVRAGTNRAAILAKVDILAHPGLITPEEGKLALENGVFLEITSKKGHSLTNGHVAKIAAAFGTRMVVDTDSHSHNDFISKSLAEKVLLGAGILEKETNGVFQNSKEIVKRVLG
jgi:histidinol phosphatase-like PHP family hydrolase